MMDRFWFLTWTTYGTWLPGDERGFVSNVRTEESTSELRHNEPGTPCDRKVRGLALTSRASLKGDPIWLQRMHAEQLLPQFQETARFRKWVLFAAAVMSNHIHLVVGVGGDPDPSDLLGDFKSYGSRCLNKKWSKPASGTWWTESGSKRKVKDEAGLFEVIAYVRDQYQPLVVWLNDEAIRTLFDPVRSSLLLKNQGADAPRSPVGSTFIASPLENQGADAPRSPAAERA